MIPIPPSECVSIFLQEAARLDIEVRWTRKDMAKLDAAYHAFPGSPGRILLHERTPKPDNQQLCTLLAHEMVHVLQHWKGDLVALPPLGWPVDQAPIGRNLSRQEQEAYTAQHNPQKILNAIKKLNPIPAQDSR